MYRSGQSLNLLLLTFTLCLYCNHSQTTSPSPNVPYPYVARFVSGRVRPFIGTTSKLTLFVYSKDSLDAAFTESHWYNIKGPIYWAQKAEVGFVDLSMAVCTAMGLSKPPITSRKFELGGTGILAKRWLGVTTDGTDLLIARVVYKTTLWGVSLWVLRNE